MPRKPRFIDIFCWAGGISQGLLDSGYKIKWAIDNNKETKLTFDYNHKIRMRLGDIRKIKSPKLGLEKKELDLLIGGPPCPTFSLVGRTKINSIEGRNVKTDERSFLYENFLNLVSFYEPKTFVMENVKGMMSAENEEGEFIVDIIQSQMEDLGYSVSVQLLNAANYGVPQHRERVFFIANRHGFKNPEMEKWETHRKPKNNNEKEMKMRTFSENGGSFPAFTKKAEKKPWNTVADALLDLPPLSPEGTVPPKTISEYIMPPLSEYQYWARNNPTIDNWNKCKLYNHTCRGHNMRDLSIYKILGEGVSWKIGDLPEYIQPYRTDIFSDKYKKQNPVEPSSTIVAHLYKDGNMFIHPREARSLTVREVARLQSFRDDFIFPVARTHAYKQIGNAVPPLLAQAIGTAIKQEILDVLG